MSQQYCECFGDIGLHASTHTRDGCECCDLCGWPVQPNSTDGAPQKCVAPSVANPERTVDTAKPADQHDGGSSNSADMAQE